MTARGRGLAAAIATAIAVVGCGFGPGESSDGTARLIVTRDYGSERIATGQRTDPPLTETVLRFLDRNTEIETRYGGGFVRSIEGLAGDVRNGRSYDWFFYVDGVESSEGAAQRRVLGGQRIWWDYRDWTDAMRVPAVVGSWPEPFAEAWADEERGSALVACASSDADPCIEAQERLNDAGAEAVVELRGDRERREAGATTAMLVGAWDRIERYSEAQLLQKGPEASGVFARFERGAGGPKLILLDVRGRPARRLGAGAGLVAAVRNGERPPTWIVTGVDASGLEAAVDALNAADLADRYAVAVSADGTLALPVLDRGRS